MSDVLTIKRKLWGFRINTCSKTFTDDRTPDLDKLKRPE